MLSKPHYLKWSYGFLPPEKGVVSFRLRWIFFAILYPLGVWLVRKILLWVIVTPQVDSGRFHIFAPRFLLDPVSKPWGKWRSKKMSNWTICMTRFLNKWNFHEFSNKTKRTPTIAESFGVVFDGEFVRCRCQFLVRGCWDSGSILFQLWIFVVFDGEFVVDPHIRCRLLPSK